MALVLVIDDHADVAEILSQLLGAHGHKTQICISGEEALVRIKDAMPNVVITDQRLPGMNGCEFVAAIRKSEDYAGLYVILWSADDSREMDALEAGANEFWVKGSEQLFEHVDRLIQRLNEQNVTGA